jgi:hypothetical protein
MGARSDRQASPDGRSWAMKQLVIGLAVLAAIPLALATHSLAQGKSGGGGGVCPDTKATQVDARIVWGGEVRRCGVGIGIFGLRLSVFGPPCPDAKYY